MVIIWDYAGKDDTRIMLPSLLASKAVYVFRIDLSAEAFLAAL